MYIRSYLARLCREHLESGNISLKDFILDYDNISHSIISKGTLAEYSQVDVLIGALPRYWRAKVVMKFELDPRAPSMFKYNKLQKHVLDKCGTADAVALLDPEGACVALGVTPETIPAGVLLPKMPVGVNLLAFPNKETTGSTKSHG